MKDKPRVLVVRLSSMGDVVLATAALEPLRQAGYEISFVTKKAFAPLLKNHPALQQVYAYDSSGGEAQARTDFLSWFGSQGFSLVIDLQDSWRTRRWRWHFKRSAKVCVARKERFREWLILYARLGRWWGFGRGGRARKFRRRAVDALSSLQNFSPATGALTSLTVTEEEKAAVRPLLPAGDFVVILPGSAWKGKEWPYFPELAKILARKVPVVALGAQKDVVCDEIARAAGPESGSRSLKGKTDLRASLAVVAQAKWVIGNDTGMVHGGEALGKDVAMVEGPTHEQMGFSPYRKGSILLGLPLVCRPCSKSGRLCVRWGSRKCLRDLTVAEVAGKLRLKGYPC